MLRLFASCYYSAYGRHDQLRKRPTELQRQFRRSGRLTRCTHQLALHLSDSMQRLRADDIYFEAMMASAIL